MEVTQTRFINLDRPYTPSCVIGRVQSTATSCGGSQVRVDASNGVSAGDSTSSDGGFCLNGGQGLPATVIFGPVSQEISFPANAGSCGAPENCLDIGVIEVTEEDCKEDEPVDLVGCECGLDETCVDGVCEADKVVEICEATYPTCEGGYCCMLPADGDYCTVTYPHCDDIPCFNYGEIDCPQ